MVIQGICIAFVFPAVLAGIYFLALVTVGLFARPRIVPAAEEAAHTIAIVIPAHNEEDLLPAALASCAALDYPADRYRVFVIADNCTDQTADIASRTSVECLIRQDVEHRGKGQALAWALPKVLARGHEAVVVLDADCRLDAHTLRVFDRHLSAGHCVLQTKVVADNPDVSPVSLAVAVGNLLENDWFYRPKDRLGWAVFLRGTGMVFRRDVLESCPFQAFSHVEDAEYTVQLLRAGQPVRFLDDVCVRTTYPVNKVQLESQRLRWAAGGWYLAKTWALRLMAEGLFTRRWLLLDAGWTMLLTSRPLVLLQLLMTVMLALLCVFLRPGLLSGLLAGAAAGVVLVHAMYGCLGIAQLGLTARRLALLRRVPLVAIWLVTISLAALAGSPARTWITGKRGAR